MKKTIQITLGRLRELINEAAVQPDKAGSSGLALYVSESTTSIGITVYDPDLLVGEIHDVLKNVRQPDQGMGEFVHDTIGNRVDPGKFVKGMIALMPPEKGQCNGAWVVKMSAAEGGFGPLLYDIAMSIVPGNTLVPDRKSTSASAGNVWRYYAAKRADVRTDSLDDVSNPVTPPEEDDCELVNDQNKPWLDVSFTGLDNSPEYERLRANHENAMWVIERVFSDNDIQAPDVRAEFELLINGLASESFFSRFL